VLPQQEGNSPPPRSDTTLPPSLASPLLPASDTTLPPSLASPLLPATKSNTPPPHAGPPRTRHPDLLQPTCQMLGIVSSYGASSIRPSVALRPCKPIATPAPRPALRFVNAGHLSWRQPAPAPGGKRSSSRGQAAVCPTSSGGSWLGLRQGPGSGDPEGAAQQFSAPLAVIPGTGKRRTRGAAEKANSPRCREGGGGCKAAINTAQWRNPLPLPKPIGRKARGAHKI
jgi:hypothetical protein